MPVANISEQLVITLKGVSDSGSEWSIEDFREHYFNGKGKGVTLRQIGHLVKVVAAYMDEVEERLNPEIPGR